MGWNTEFADLVEKYYVADNALPSGVTLNVVNHGCQGGEASTYYDQYFLSGDDIDIYAAEADWVLSYLNQDDKSLALSKLGIDGSEFENSYDYTVDIAKDSDGVLKGATWQCCPGAFAYRTDLAETYLGVKTPEEMQEKVKDWDTFLATAKEVYTASGDKKTALTTSVGGMWQVFSTNRGTAWVEDDALVIDDSCKDFIDLAHTMVTEGYCANKKQWAEDGSWLAAGSTDSTMGYFVTTWAMGSVVLGAAAGNTYDDNGDISTEGATYGKWGLCQGPSGFFWGGTWIVASPNTDNGDIVEDIIRYFTIDETSMAKISDGEGLFVNNQNVMSGRTNEDANLGGQDQFAVFAEGAADINLNGLITEYDATVKSNFQAAYDAYNNGELDSTDATIEKFKENVASVLSNITVE